MDVSAKQLVSLFKESINFSQPNTLDGSVESIRNYYKMIRQFATMAHMYQDLIPEKYDDQSILELAGFILDLNFEDFQKIGNNLPYILDGFSLQDKTTSYPEADVDPSWEPTIAMLSKKLPDKIDLTTSNQDDLFFEAATDLLNKYPDTFALQNLDRWITSNPEKYKNAMLLVSKQALSMYVKQIDYPLHVSLVLAMYNEHNRIRPKSNDNPNGEDFVRRKMKQMEWLLKDSPLNFNMILVDDGCPKQSGEKAKALEIIGKEGYKNVKVLYLYDGIKRQSVVIKGLRSTSDSRKGGSIQYGMWQAPDFQCGQRENP